MEIKRLNNNNNNKNVLKINQVETKNSLNTIEIHGRISFHITATVVNCCASILAVFHWRLQKIDSQRASVSTAHGQHVCVSQGAKIDKSTVQLYIYYCIAMPEIIFFFRWKLSFLSNFSIERKLDRKMGMMRSTEIELYQTWAPDRK